MDKYNFSVGKIVAVIVTYNRLAKLKKALASYEQQLHKPDYMVIVDNASTDGTAGWLEHWRNDKHEFQVEIIRSNKNLGGSGGFYLGEERAMQLPVDWIMIADDDAYPTPNYIQGLVKYIEKNNTDNISIMCGAVKQNGSITEHTHRAYLKKNLIELNLLKSVSANDYNKEKLKITFVSYVGILINKDKMKNAGLVAKDRFIWCDDTEHSYRLSKFGEIIFLPKYVILHDVEKNRAGLTWKNYYGFRNWLVFHKTHFKITFVPTIIVFLLKTILSPLKWHSLKVIKMRLLATKDAIMGNMGINDVYKPGWKP